MGREPVQVKACLQQRPWASWITSRSVLDPPSKTATMARPTLSSSRVSSVLPCAVALRCPAQHHAVNKTLTRAMPCLVCQEPLGPCAGGVFGPTGMHRSTHGSRTSCHRGQEWPGGFKSNHVVQLVRLVRVRASAGQGMGKAKTKAGLDPKSRYDIVRRTCSRPRRRQRKRGEGAPGPTGESSLRFSSTGPLLRSGDVWRSSKQSIPTNGVIKSGSGRSGPGTLGGGDVTQRQCRQGRASTDLDALQLVSNRGKMG